MSRPGTDRLKVNPQLGRVPTLQFCRPAELRIDPAYQRSVEGGSSQALIRKIAMYWNWDLCQPLVVARREGLAGDRFYVIDGQHRLEAARARGDIDQLPCVMVQFDSVADEAASFVHLNQQRQPLTKLDVFKAAVASGDTQASAIVAAMTEAGLAVAPHGNFISWKPGMVSNIGGIEAAWRSHGGKATKTALRALAQAFGGQVLRYAGTVFPGIAAVCGDEQIESGRFAEDRFERFLTVLARRNQFDWRAEINRLRGEEPNLSFGRASALAVRRAWARDLDLRSRPAPDPRPAIASVREGPAEKTKMLPEGTPLPGFLGKRWCDQCDDSVDHKEAKTCKSRFCSLRKVA